jgi:hypothetical protein
MSAQPDPQAGLGIGTDADQQETREWMDALSAVIDRGPRARPLPAGATAGTCPPEQHRPAVFGQHRLREHHRARAGSALPRQHRHRKAPARLHALERHGHGGACQPPQPRGRRRSGRPHRLLRLAGQHVRRRLQPLLARRERKPRRRLPLHPGPQRPRHLRPRLPGRPPDRRAARTSARKWTARACPATRTPS